MENLKLIELTKKECQQINGGESGWYYLGKASRWAVEQVCAGVIWWGVDKDEASASGGCTVIC